MHLIAQGLGTPQIQEKLVTALQQSQQQSQLAPGQQRGDLFSIPALDPY